MPDWDATAVAPTHASSFATVRRIVVNMTSLLTNDVLNRAATFVVYALVARYCGSRSFGQLSLGLTLLSTFMFLASAGLPTLIMREVAKRPTASGRYFVNACAIAIGAFFLCLGALALLTIVSRYPADTREVLLLIGLSILPGALTWITEAVLKAWERMHVILLVALPVNVAKVGLAYYFLSTGHGVRTIALVLLGCQVAIVLSEWLLLFRFVPLSDAEFDLRFCRHLLKHTWRFLGIDSLTAMWGSINAVLLSWFVGEEAVGLFGAAYQLLVPVSLTLQAVDTSLFPMMCRRAETSRANVQQLTVLLLEIMAVLAVPGCILLYFGAGPIISAVYGHDDFANSVLVLRIMLPVLLLQAIVNTFGQVLYSHRDEHLALRILIVDVLFNVAFGAAAIYAFGLVGAAVTVLATWTLNAYLHFAAARKRLTNDQGQSVSWNTTLIVQVIAAGCIMAGALALLSRFNFILASILTSILYLIVLAAFVYVACRGPLGIRERFLTPLREQ
jgi:O-antigen/teichoic acid export membrane protein